VTFQWLPPIRDNRGISMPLGLQWLQSSVLLHIDETIFV
jgi:hypothetical protein